MADESPQSQLWRDTFMQQLRSKPHSPDYIAVCKDAKDAANMAVKAYNEAFPVAAPVAATAAPPPAKPAKAGVKP